MRRREFTTLLGGAAAAWPITAGSQQTVRHIGVLLPATADDPEYQARIAAFHQGLALSDWTIGRNVRIETYADAPHPLRLLCARGAQAIRPEKAKSCLPRLVFFGSAAAMWPRQSQG